jgi:hypothetical protein
MFLLKKKTQSMVEGLLMIQKRKKKVNKITPKKYNNQNNTHYIEVDQYYTTKTKKLIYIYNIITTYTI